MTAPKPGDRVRVTAPRETVVRETGWYPGKHLVAQGKATVEVIEPADDPSRDPVGTVRKSPGATVVAKTPGGEWEVFVSGIYNTDTVLMFSGVTGWEIIGAVPGTPAAAVQEPKLRTVVDGDGNSWFEVEPGGFKQADDRDQATRFFARGWGFVRSLEDIAGKFGVESVVA